MFSNISDPSNILVTEYTSGHLKSWKNLNLKEESPCLHVTNNSIKCYYNHLYQIPKQCTAELQTCKLIKHTYTFT